jgi:hypothetical protein
MRMHIWISNRSSKSKKDQLKSHKLCLVKVKRISLNPKRASIEAPPVTNPQEWKDAPVEGLTRPACRE